MAVGNLRVTNFHRTSLSTSIPNETDPDLLNGRAIEVQDASGFPQDMLAGDYWYLTILGTGGQIEIVRVASIAGNVLQVIREGFDSTTPGQYFAAGSSVENWFTAQAFRDVRDAVSGLVVDGVTADDTTIGTNESGELAVKTTAAGGGLDADAYIKPNTMGGGQLKDNAVSDANILDVAASKVTGTLADGNIPDLNASKVIAGEFPTARIPTLPGTKIQESTLNFKHLAYTEQSAGTVPDPSGGTPGEIIFEFET